VVLCPPTRATDLTSNVDLTRVKPDVPAAKEPPDALSPQGCLVENTTLNNHETTEEQQ
jgi:hypothetical protein